VTAPDLLAALAALGATVTLREPDRLRIEAPPGALSPELWEALKEQKPVLLTLLREPPRVRAHLCAGCKRFFFPEPAFLCYWCRKSRSEAPTGPPCDGCGEACEQCVGEPAPEERRHEAA
jgi:hypothetical protein